MQFDGLWVPDWTFDLEEVSNNVFRLKGKHVLGPRVEVKGTDVNQLQREVLASVKELDAEIASYRTERIHQGNRGVDEAKER
jgi:hypothetical protein